MSITEIKTKVLKQDLLMSIADVLLCDEVIKKGQTLYSGGSLLERRRASIEIVGKTYQELCDREIDKAHAATAGIGYEPG